MSGQPAARNAASGEPGKWVDVSDELRSHQSLTSVINDPSKGRSIFRGRWDGIGDFWDKIRESVEEIGEQREADVKAASDATIGDSLIGPIPDVTDFQPYLDSFVELWDVYARNHKTRRCGEQVTGRSDGNKDDASACDAHRGVPHVYFQDDFKLEHHQIFRQSLQTSVERQEELNAELTGHLDMVEVSLFEHIRQAQRDQLFDSLATLGEPLQEDLRSTLSVVKVLRGRLRSLKRTQLHCGMAVGRLARRKQRVGEVLQRLELLAHVQQSQPAVQMLLQGQDYGTALDLLESTKSALESNLQGLVSVKPGCTRLRGLGGTFDRVVEADFVHHSTEAILGDPYGGVALFGNGEVEGDEVEAEDLEKDGCAVFIAAAPELHGAERLRRLCRCLARRELLKTALSSTLRDVLLSHLKKLLKHHSRALLESVRVDGRAGNEPLTPEACEEPSAGQQQPVVLEDEGASVGTDSVAQAEEAPLGGDAPRQSESLAAADISAALRSLPFEKFRGFWKRLMRSCVHIASRFCEYASLVGAEAESDTAVDCSARPTEMVSAPAFRAGSGSPRKCEMEVSTELLRLLQVVMNSLLQKIGVLLQARQSEHRVLKMADWQPFLKFTNSAIEQVRMQHDRCRQKLQMPDAPAGIDVGGGLRAVLYTQTKQVIEEFHSMRLAQLQQVLEQERWDRSDVPQAYRDLLEQLVNPEHKPEANGAQQQTVERHLDVDSFRFLVVPAVLTLIQVLAEYVQLLRELDALGAEIVQRMVHLLRLFNQQAQKLVLGGQAVQRHQLKKITAANLALCSQCCGLVARILPKLHTNLLGILQRDRSGGAVVAAPAQTIGAALLGDLLTIAAEYEEHRTALFGKLSDLLRERYDFHARKWLSTVHPSVQADALLWIEGDGVHGGFPQEIDLSPHDSLDGLVKDITSMYRILLKSLAGDSVKRIFAKAFTEIAVTFEQRLGQELSAPSPPYEDKVGRSLGDRLAMDLAFLQEQLKSLGGIATPLQHLLTELVHHLQAKLEAEDPTRRLHPSTIDALQRLGRLPH